MQALVTQWLTLLTKEPKHNHLHQPELHLQAPCARLLISKFPFTISRTLIYWLEQKELFLVLFLSQSKLAFNLAHWFTFPPATPVCLHPGWPQKSFPSFSPRHSRCQFYWAPIHSLKPGLGHSQCCVFSPSASACWSKRPTQLRNRLFPSTFSKWHVALQLYLNQLKTGSGKQPCFATLSACLSSAGSSFIQHLP